MDSISISRGDTESKVSEIAGKIRTEVIQSAATAFADVDQKYSTSKVH